jgi:peptide/nickel transport system permease protein
LGTDELGRDNLSRLLAGARISLSVGFVAVGVSLLRACSCRLPVTPAAGRCAITRIIDVFLSVPSFFLILTVNAYLDPSICNTMVVIGLFS